MTPRERVTRCLCFEHPDRAPRDLWALAGVSMLRRGEFDDMLAKYPSDFEGPKGRYGVSHYSKGTPAEIGEYTDEWGCVWNVAEIGVCGEVKRPPIEDWSRLASYKLPWEILDGADLRQVNRGCAETDKFVKCGTSVRPFERMQFLRGTENLLVDLAWQPAEFLKLCEMLHEFFLRDVEMWTKTDVDGIGFMDDWGAQSSLLISPDLWRTIFKPMYKDYCDLIKGSGKYVFFHSAGSPARKRRSPISKSAMRAQRAIFTSSTGSRPRRKGCPVR